MATISPNAAATGTWSYDGVLIPHPIQFMSHRVSDSVATVNVGTHNAQIPGSSPTEKYYNFRSMCKRWRLAFMSVTVHQDGPDLANQGTIVVSQVPVEPHIYNPCAQVIGESNSRIMQVGPHVAQFNSLDMPNYVRSQAMPNAYFNNSKFGAYVPLKLTRTHQDWQSESTQYSIAQIQNSEEALAANGSMYTSTVSPSNPWPFQDIAGFGLQTASAAAGTEMQAYNLVGGWTGDVTSALCNDNWAHISCRNMAVTTSLSFFIRVGFEMQVSPSSILSPQQKLSPPSDELAVRNYFAIARELKDAYPEDFNSLDKLWSVIKGVAKVVLPIAGTALSAFPQTRPLGLLVSGLTGQMDGSSSQSAPSERITDKALRTTVSEAQLERARARRKAPKAKSLVKITRASKPKRR